jgi:RNA polymerase sigma-70 factor (sigma-E family)
MTERAVPTFDEFVATRGAALLRHAYVLSGDRHTAEDLVQETLAGLYRRWDRVAAASSPEAYVRTTMTRQYLTWRRRRSFAERAWGDLPDQASPVDAITATDADDVVWRALGALPRKQRVILALRFYDDQSDTQIASILGISASNVRAQAARGIATLRTRVAASDVTGALS